jgi:hypothetical protein
MMASGFIDAPKRRIMDAKVVFLSAIIAFAAASSAMAQGAPPSGGVTAPPDRPLVPPGLDSGSELGRYNDTYLALRSFWSDDIISSFFKHLADGTLNQVTSLVAELCEKWRQRDPRLPITGIITVPPGIELDLNRLCG